MNTTALFHTLAALLVAATGTLNAQADDGTATDATTLLKGNKVTEANLLDALTPPTDDVVTRGLKINRDHPVLQAKKPSASLLITFLTNSAELSPSAKKQLDVVANALKNDRLAEYSFNVEGHADPRGTSDGNLTLSQQRADSVRSYLVGTHGIAADRLKAEGRGDRDLLNRNVPAAPENRRVTIVTNLN